MDFERISFQIVSVEVVFMFGVLLIVVLHTTLPFLSTSKLGPPQGYFPQHSGYWNIGGFMGFSWNIGDQMTFKVFQYNTVMNKCNMVAHRGVVILSTLSETGYNCP